MSRPSVADPCTPFMLDVLTNGSRLSVSRLCQMVQERAIAATRQAGLSDVSVKVKVLPFEYQLSRRLFDILVRTDRRNYGAQGY